MDAIIRFAIFEGNIQNFSSVVKDTFVHDGSTTTFILHKLQAYTRTHEWFTIVKLNDTILKSRL